MAVIRTNVPSEVINCERSKRRSLEKVMLMERPEGPTHEMEGDLFDVLGDWGSNRNDSITN